MAVSCSHAFKQKSDFLRFFGILVVALSLLAAIAPIGSLASADTSTAPGPCEDGYVAPTPTNIPVTSVPITVNSTTADYFVLYVRASNPHTSTKDRPILVKLGEDGTTTLSENLAPLSASRYRLDKFSVAQPGDLDGDCVDDVTELKELGTYNPINSGKKLDITNGAVAISSREMFQTLSFNGDTGVRGLEHLNGLEFVKFSIRSLSGETPAAYFINSNTHKIHANFDRAIGVSISTPTETGNGTIVYYPHVAAPDGSLGVYAFRFSLWGIAGLSTVEGYYETLAAGMPFLKNNLYYHPVTESQVNVYKNDKSRYDSSRVNVLLDEDINPDVDYIPFNQAEGYGRLRLMAEGDRPSPFDVAIYTTLPNDLPRVAGTITTVPQTPLSHVNLRAIQNGLPNAYIRDALKDDTIKSLVDSYVYYAVGADGYTIRAATKADVDQHFQELRPPQTQTLQRDLTKTSITSLANVSFSDWDAFGVKAANLAELTKLSLPSGTTPVGYAVPFYFYDEFMKQATLGEQTILGKKKAPDAEKITLSAETTLAQAVSAMLAHSYFQTDSDIQEEMLDDLRKAIKNATSPSWIITALNNLHGAYPDGQSLRYRSSTNNEDLPAFSGAGLYDSKTQDPDETTADGIDKSIKAVWASLWNHRAFLERDFHRVDHTTVAMGVLVHPNYSDELVNGVAVSYDPITFQDNAHYINSQVGEDLVTNPEANSQPEQLLLSAAGSATVLSRSSLAKSNKLLMSAAQMRQLRSNLDTIHNRFRTLYEVQDGEDFAIEIEFKITAANKIAIKQARPWIFPEPLVLPNPEVSIALSSAQVAEGESLDLTATRSGGILSTPLTVDLAWSETQAMLSNKPASVTIPGNQTSASIAVPIDDDQEDEDDSVVTVSISADSAYTIGTPGSASATITDDDLPSTTPEVSITAGSGVAEGAAASFTLTASPKPAVGLDVTVAVSQDGDFGVATGSRTVTIPASGSFALTVATSDDSDDEADGSVTATVEAGSGYTVSSGSAAATVVVSDDDGGCSVVLPDDAVTVSEVTGWRDALSAAAWAGVKRFNRVLAALGTDTGHTPMTADQAQGVADWLGNTRWDRISRTLAALEQAQCDVEPEVSIAAGSGVTEGSAASFTVTASPAPTAALTVDVMVSQSGDFGVTAGGRAVTVPTTGSKTFTVATANDAADEADGSVTVSIDTGTGYTVSTSSGSATVAVSDDDDPPPPVPEISIAAGSGVTEGGAASFTLTASPAPAAPLTVNLTVAQSGDFGVSAGSRAVTIPASGSKAFTVATVDDSADEADGSVTVSVGSGTGYAVSSAQGAASVAVSDDDVPEISIAAGSGVVEGSAASFTLTASPKPAVGLDVAVAVSQSGDFGVATGSRTVAVTASGSATFTVATSGDSDDEADGSVTVSVGSGTGYTVSSSAGSTSVAVSDDDVPLVVADVCVSALEGDGSVAGQWTDACDSEGREGRYARFFTFSLAQRATVTIDLESSVDTYLFLRSGLGRDGGELSRNDDGGDGYNSRISESLAAGDYTVEATTFSRSTTGAFTLSVDGLTAQQPPAVLPEISIAAGSGVTEGGAASFTLTASPAPTSALAVDVTVSQSGDFGVTAGARTVTIPTSGSYILTVATTGDSTDEADGSVTVSVSSGTGYTVSSSNSSATVAVSDDDDPPPPPPPPADCVSDETLGLARDYYELNRDRAPGYGRNWLRVLVAFGDVVDDQVTAFTAAEALEREQLWFGWRPFREALECIEAAQQPASPQISIAAGSGVTEGSAASFTLTASPAPAAALTVDVTVSQSGDFGVTTGARTVTISTAGTFALSVDTTGDSADEADGSVTVTIDTGTGYTVSSSAGSATVAVSDDDDPAPPPPPPAEPEISIAAGSDVTEGTAATFTLTASPAPTTALSVSVTVAQSGSFGVSTGARTVTIPTGGSYTLTVATTDDTTDEADGSVTATVGSGTGYTVSSSAGAATVAVSDDDDAAPPPNTPVISIVGGTAVTEGGNATFTITASPAPTAPLTVSLTVSQSGNYYLLPGTTTIQMASSGTYTLRLGTRDDSTDEPDGSLTVTVDSGTGYTVSSAQGAATVAVSDNDLPSSGPPTVTVSDATAVEGAQNLVFVVTLSKPNPDPITFRYGGYARTATLWQDWTIEYKAFTLDAGDTTIDLTVPVIDDDTPENDETLRIYVYAISGIVIRDGFLYATGTITDND
ncbi:PEP/pyruvate-binding domain-containing protein [Candidatus Poriferisocius sp.]|uniref:PEP/pyruvate-binding domain-containing protein n=1 Tax=Candidatus Poriferisocius sp. TaxID=3101276 RepID=UPI003B52BC58